MINRKTFLKQAGILSAGLFIKPAFLLPTAEKVVGLQLYSLKEQLPKDLKGVIARVAEAGYKEVETYGYNTKSGFWGLGAKEFSQLLKDNGLSSPSGHYGFNQYFSNGGTEDLKSYVDAAHATGQEYIIIPYLNEQFIKTAEDFKEVAQKMNTIAGLLKKENLKLGYHNHNFEWKPVDSTTFYNTLLQYTDPNLVFMEIDIYWAVRAGQNPIAIFDKNKGRFCSVHIKDMDKINPNLNTEVGNGTIDFRRIIPKAKAAGVTKFIMEQENFTDIDPYVSIKQSADYIKNILDV